MLPWAQDPGRGEGLGAEDGGVSHGCAERKVPMGHLEDTQMCGLGAQEGGPGWRCGC